MVVYAKSMVTLKFQRFTDKVYKDIIIAVLQSLPHLHGLFETVEMIPFISLVIVGQ